MKAIFENSLLVRAILCLCAWYHEGAIAHFFARIREAYADSRFRRLWERFCALHGIDTLYQTSCRLCGHIRDKDIPGAVAWIDYCTRETVSGSRRIYY